MAKENLFLFIVEGHVIKWNPKGQLKSTFHSIVENAA